ncbi:uncharacterized protein GGS22DRAFT_166459 [Annulohypoxylon maeteangense]|uniref:uncharacterized protein n=1 Tax=Annulohypoxylon maeteangense TaxID=1927788 RepID=UPI002007888C|nr:uncharacterized protein GGS22DRAFT_166459 [Annulohypoxylon maeteangense]KAI0883937.1 hypothetical protein GGS22DRAFT_166459 [Annulohypoxylon maeteangense]
MVPMSKLGHLPLNHPVVILKMFTNTMSAATVEKLYSIAPSLNDSPSAAPGNASRIASELDVRDTIIRFLFRELLLHKADADVLVRATRIRSIDTFLRDSSVEDLEYYIRFFEAFQEGRSDTFHLLRDAVCDYLLDPQPSSTTILGAGISTDDSPRRMTTKGWDILYANFYDIVDWWNLESFAIQFEDFVIVKTLSVMLRYGSGDSSNGSATKWHVPDEDVSQECTPAVMQGFIAVTKGFSDPIGPSIKTENGITQERHTRSYVVGRMEKKCEYALQLIQELSERVEKFLVLVYDWEKRPSSRHLISPPLADQNPWITRFRSASKKEVLSSQPWVVEWSLEDILDDVESMGALMGNSMTKDYFEFIIIDRAPGRPFDILDVVADALSKLKGDPSYAQISRQAVQKYIPSNEQEAYFEELTHMQLTQFPPAISPQYVGNRIRCWDIPDALHDILRTVLLDKSRTTTQQESRLISKVSADLESHGVLTKILEYEPSNMRPVMMPGIDGLEDLYFPYDLGPRKESAPGESVFDFGPWDNDLFEFSEKYKRAHPNALFAKGRVNVPYCAWPCPNLTGPRHSRLNFSTPEGRMYRWNKLPFDMPMASHVWQIFVNLQIHNNLSFVRIVQSTLVICAEDRDDAAANLKALIDLGEKNGLTFSIPSPVSWTSDIGKLGLESLWEGIRVFL